MTLRTAPAFINALEGEMGFILLNGEMFYQCITLEKIETYTVISRTKYLLMVLTLGNCYMNHPLADTVIFPASLNTDHLVSDASLSLVL